MTFLRIVIPLYALFEHDLCPKTGIHFSGSCTSAPIPKFAKRLRSL